MKKSRALLFPLVLLIATCIRVDAPAPAPAPRSVSYTTSEVTAASVGWKQIVVELDDTGRIAVKNPIEYARTHQRVEWVMLDPDVKIEIFWKSHPSVEKPCPTAARRCGGRLIPVPANTRLEYGIRGYREGSSTPFDTLDPILEILR